MYALVDSMYQFCFSLQLLYSIYLEMYFHWGFFSVAQLFIVFLYMIEGTLPRNKNNAKSNTLSDILVRVDRDKKN